MKAFVTGGTGFIGSHLVDSLNELDQYDEVYCLVRDKEKWLEDKPYRKVTGDLHNLKALQDGLRDIDVLFHVAGKVSAPDLKQLNHTNVEGTENVVRVALKQGVQKIVILSSLAAVGPSFKRPVNEGDPLMPISMYGESKKSMELKIQELADENSSITIIRPPAVYGPREDQIFSFFKIASMGIAPKIKHNQAGTSQKISLVYVADLIQGILKAADNQHKGLETYFISSPRGYSWDEIQDAVSRSLGKRVISLSISSKLVRNIANVNEKVGSVFGRYPLLNKEKANEMTMEWICSIQKAEQELNYAPRFSLTEGIDQTLQWYKKHHWL